MDAIASGAASEPSEESRTAGGSIQTRDLTVAVKGGRLLLDHLSFSVPRGSFVAVIGLSGCGKSTLIRTLCGLIAPTEGHVRFSGHDVHEVKSEYPLAVGYIPQFGTFHSGLTVREILSHAVSLRLPPSVSPQIRAGWLEHVIALSGVGSLMDQPFRTLSGGQMRRVALAEELVGDPSFLLLDELTTGLDTFSDGEMMDWLKQLAHAHGKTVVLVTHNTEHLPSCDKIAFLHQGRLVRFCGYSSLLAAEGVDSIKSLFGKYSRGNTEPASVPAATEPDEEARQESLQTDLPPSGWLQFPTLVGRQWQLFLRDFGQLWVQALLIVLFPIIVAVFALDGLPQIMAVSDSEGSLLKAFETRILELKNSASGASVVSGLILFQVILLTLMGANNGAREVARERDVLAKELFAGLSAPAYLAAKFSHVLFLSLIQAFWMAGFVKLVCGFPGSFLAQFSILAATTMAMSVTCLAISAASPTAERASLLSIYLVGFQLPLSGAALALPDWLGVLCRPFIAAYWGWCGYLQTLDSTRYLRLVEDSTKTPVASYDLSILVLSLHILLATAAAAYLVKRLPKVSP